MSDEDQQIISALQRIIARWAIGILAMIVAISFSAGVWATTQHYLATQIQQQMDWQFADVRRSLEELKVNDQKQEVALQERLKVWGPWRDDVTRMLDRNTALSTQHENRITGLENKVYRNP